MVTLGIDISFSYNEDIFHLLKDGDDTFLFKNNEEVEILEVVSYRCLNCFGIITSTWDFYYEGGLTNKNPNFYINEILVDLI
jgi:hypothetical protein